MRADPVSPDVVRQALAHLPAACDRDTWVKVAMGLKAEFGNDTGYDLFDAWSRSAGDDSYDAKAALATWKSIKPGGGVTIASVLKLAKLQGFEIPKEPMAPAKPDPVEAAQRVREQQEARQREQLAATAAQEQATKAALSYWAGLTSSRPAKPTYLERKAIGDHGVRFDEATGTTVVPMCDADGTLRNVQRILPHRPANGGLDKFFGPPGVRGGRKAGLMHAVELDLVADIAAPAVLLLAEGYATACSLNEAT